MSCDSCTMRANQNMNTPNLMFAQESYQGNVSIHADYPQFEQVSQAQFTALLREIGATNSRVARNEVNLIKMGKDATKLGQDAIWFGKEITKLKSSPKGSGFTKSQIESILVDFYGDDISRLDRLHREQESRITDGFSHRKSIENKVDSAKAEHSDFHTKFSDFGDSIRTIGDKLDEAKSERDRLDSKIDGHSHGNGGTPECAFYDIPCMLRKGAEDSVKQVAILGALGVGGYLLLKKM